MRSGTLLTKVFFLAALFLIAAGGCQRRSQSLNPKSTEIVPPGPVAHSFAPDAPPEVRQLVDSAIEQTRVTHGYDPSYISIDYRGGDVPL